MATLTAEARSQLDSRSMKDLTIEKTYQKKSQLEHILLRPDTYIGSVEHVLENMWVYDSEKGQMIQRPINYCPGLYKIFDEILVNAADNKQRDKSMDCIKIVIDQEMNVISVWNNGEGIPVVMHKEENMFVPTMIFGHLLTSSNYDDDLEKVVGGRNGYGAKLCNIFSTKFTVETASSEYKKSFKQTWKSNMSKASEASINSYSGKDYTKVTFSPDLAKFGMEKLDNDIVALMSRRAYDVAASTQGVKVFLNGERINIKGFLDYVKLYVKNRKDDTLEGPKIIHEIVNQRWEVAVTLSDRGFQQVSFVNSIATTKGGRHVDYVTDIIVKQLLEVVKKKNKGGVTLKPFHVKNHLWIFINCLIVNPAFDSQTKENMTTQAKKFGSTCDITEKFITSVTKSGIIETILTWAKFKAETDLNKNSGKKTSKLRGVPKLEDANEAGTKNSHKCTLILTEGDSAKGLAVSGLAVIGRDYYGVFPLKGKLLNVREAAHRQIMENAEINNLIKIIGLQFKKKYESIDDLKTLRYGKVMIMTDQDQDGSHIKGLIINFIHNFWPELLRLNFLEVFITPIVKIFKKNVVIKSFYSLPELEEWKQETSNYKSYHIKYYKGLGTSDSKEAKEYFENMERNKIALKYNGPDDDQSILLAFSKKKIDSRKEWLLRHNEELKQRKELGLPEIYLYQKDTRTVTFTEYVNKELVYYSNADNIRSIPNLVDGVKPGQRKVLFTCFKRADKREVKVAQLAGAVAEMSAYHHGEVSLCMTIVNLAQNFVGSNNINLLQPKGQFGTRLQGGKDSASARYIFTKLSPLARLIFHPDDDPLLKYEKDDNLKIEPFWYIPIIPMVLVNGAEGIGTGWSTKIPNFNPRDIVANIFRLINDEALVPMKPWYKNFKGVIEYCDEMKYISSGEIAITEDNKIEITELPIGTWTQVYKENVLESMLHGTEKSKSLISDYKEYSTDTTVKFVVMVPPEQLRAMETEGLHQIFKLQTPLSVSNLVLFDEYGGIKKYDTVEDILKEFYAIRLRMYTKRKEYLEESLEAETSKLTYQAKFIMEKCSGKIHIENKQRNALIDELIKLGYPSDPVVEWKIRFARESNDDFDNGNENDEDNYEDDEKESSSPKKHTKNIDQDFVDCPLGKKYNYLLGLSLWMLTLEKKNQLLSQRDEKITQLRILKEKTPTDMWRDDLYAFLDKLDEVEEKERKSNLDNSAKKSLKSKGPRKDKVSFLNTEPSMFARRIEPKIVEVKKVSKAKSRDKLQSKSQLPKEKDEFDTLLEENKKTLKEKVNESVSDSDIITENVLKESNGKRKINKTTKRGPKGKKAPKEAILTDILRESMPHENTSIVITPREKPTRKLPKFNYCSSSSDEELWQIKQKKKLKVLENSDEDFKLFPKKVKRKPDLVTKTTKKLKVDEN